MTITRAMPPIIRQSRIDTCWAAILESWSRIDGRLPHLRQEALIDQWGEGSTGGITPRIKIPAISREYGLQFGGFAGGELVARLEQFLSQSHMFCAYTRGSYTHAVLIYRMSDRGNISYIDPDGGHDRWQTVDWFNHRGPYILMRK
ncbi:MAG: hypothetical protein ABIQ62_01990 [Thermomonas sp.]